jgi:hypothetical protein
MWRRSADCTLDGMNRRPGHVTVTTEVAMCSFCGRPRNLRREEHQLGTLVRTIVTCETCHRTLSSTMGVAAADPAPAAEAPAAAVEAPAAEATAAKRATAKGTPAAAAKAKAAPKSTKARTSRAR